ncbi:Hemolysin secretion protein D, chromosomal [compost metagenome]
MQAICKRRTVIIIAHRLSAVRDANRILVMDRGQKLGLVYSTRIQLKENSIQVGENRIDLSPGIAVRAEVKTDKRKVIYYFLSPLREYKDESLMKI